MAIVLRTKSRGGEEEEIPVLSKSKSRVIIVLDSLLKKGAGILNENANLFDIGIWTQTILLNTEEKAKSIIITSIWILKLK